MDYQPVQPLHPDALDGGGLLTDYMGARSSSTSVYALPAAIPNSLLHKHIVADVMRLGGGSDVATYQNVNSSTALPRPGFNVRPGHPSGALKDSHATAWDDAAPATDSEDAVPLSQQQQQPPPSKALTSLSSPQHLMPTFPTSSAAAFSPSLPKDPSSAFVVRDKTGFSLTLALSLKRDALASITERESLIARLLQLKLADDPMTTKAHIKRMLVEIRNASFFAVEGIQAWKRAIQTSGTIDMYSHDPSFSSSSPMKVLPSSSSSSSSDPNLSADPPPPVFFRYRDENYLVKMLSDLDFLTAVPQIASCLPQGHKPIRNPFVMLYTVDDLNALEGHGDDFASRELARARRCSRIILEEEKAEYRRKFPEQQQYAQPLKKIHHKPQHTVFESLSVPEQRRRKESFDAYSSDGSVDSSNSHLLAASWGGGGPIPRAPDLNIRELQVFAALKNPPVAVTTVFACVRILLAGATPPERGGGGPSAIPQLTRRILRNMLKRPVSMVQALEEFDPSGPISGAALSALYPIVTNPKFEGVEIRKASESVGALAEWLTMVVVCKCESLGWVSGVNVRSQPVTPFVVEDGSVRKGKETNKNAKKGQKPKSYTVQPITSPTHGDSSSDDDEHANVSKGSAAAISMLQQKEANEYVDLLRKLQREIEFLKQDLNNQGLINGENYGGQRLGGNNSTSDGDDDTQSYSSSVMAPPLNQAAVNPSPFSTVHLAQESIRLEGRQLIVKVAYIDHGSKLLFTAWDTADNRSLKATTVPALYCDQLTSYTPVELEAMPETFRRQKLRSIVDNLRIESEDSLSIELDRLICNGKRVIDDTVRDFKIIRTIENDGVVVSLSPPVTSPTSPALSLQISDGELELLLAHQPGLFLRSQRKWSSQRAISDWLITRVILMKGSSGIDGGASTEDYLTVDRNVPVPRNLESGQTKQGKKYQLRARQFNNEIILEAIPGGDVGEGDGEAGDDGDDDNSSGAHHPGRRASQVSRPMSRVKIGLAEFQSLGAPGNIPELDEFPLRPNGLYSRSGLPGTAEDSDQLELGRPAKTPLDSLLSRLSWSIKNGQPVLGINRVVYQEKKSISGVAVLLRASVMNRDVIFQATRLKPKSGKGGSIMVAGSIDEESPYSEHEKVGEELVRLVTEVEAEKLLASEPESKRAFLMHPSNRRELCILLSQNLKMIKANGAYRLETNLYREKALLAVAVDGNHRDDVIGAVDIDDQTTLADLRNQILSEMDEEDLPTSFRFVYKNAPCSRAQEKNRLATACLPIAIILARKRRGERPNSAPHAGGIRSGSNNSDGDSEFGNPGSRYSWDSDGSSRSGSAKRKQRRRKFNKKLKKKAHSDDDVQSAPSDLSDDNSGTDADVTPLGNKAPRSSFVAASRRSSEVGNEEDGKKKEKRRRSTKPPTIDKQIIAKSGGFDTVVEEEEKRDIAAPVEEAPPKPVEEKSKRIIKVPVPLESLVTATQGSTVLKTQVDMTSMVSRGDALRIHKCTGGYADWVISGDLSHAFDATTLTLTKPYHHHLRSEENKELTEKVFGGGSKKEAESDEIAPAGANLVLPSPALGGGRMSVIAPNPLPSPMNRRGRGIGGTIQGQNAPLIPLSLSMGRKTDPGEDEDEDDMDDENKIHEEGAVFENLRCWLLVLPSMDKRQQWRKQFDDGLVPWEDDFEDSLEGEKHFHVRIKWAVLEKFVKDVYGQKTRLMPEQRLNHFDKVKPSKIVAEAFGVLCRWHPVSSTIDNSKWAKFAREMKLFPSKNSSQVDLAFTRSVVGKKDKKLDLRGFIACCTDIALVRYPDMKDKPNDALMTMLMESVVLLPQVNKLVWKEAKRLALVAQARRICAQIRLATLHRRLVDRGRFLKKKRLCVRIQRCARRIISLRNFIMVQRMFESDRKLRLRCVSAMKCQKMFRMHHARCVFEKHKIAKKMEERRLIALYRKGLNDKRKTREAATLFKTVTMIQGFMTLVVMVRKDNRRQSTDYGILIKCYLPSTQETFKFIVEEEKLREYIEESLEQDGLSVTELMAPSSLRTLIERLMVRITNGHPIILFSRRNTTERGILMHKVGQKISDDLYIIFVYRSADDLVFRAYDSKSSKIMRTALLMTTCRQWLIEDDYRQKRKEEKAYAKLLSDARKLIVFASAGNDVPFSDLVSAKAVVKGHAAREKEKQAEKEKKQRELEDAHNSGFGVSRKKYDDEDDDDDGGGTNRLVEAQTQPATPADGDLAVDGGPDGVVGKKALALIEAAEPELMQPENIKGLMNWLLSRLKVVRNRRSGRTKLLFQYEEDNDIKDTSAIKIQGMARSKVARRRARKKCRQQFEKMWDKSYYCYYYMNVRTGIQQWTKPLVLGSEDLDDPKDEWRKIAGEEGTFFYMNPATGQTSHMTEDEAAKKMQRMVRNYQAADIGTPTMADVIKSMRFEMVSEENYAKDPTKLANICNYALLNHCLHHNFVKARECYKVAYEKSQSNPVLSRAYAIFMLASGEAPKKKTFEKAVEMCKSAKLSDPELEKFAVAQESFFHWAVIVNPKNPISMLNYAILHQLVLGEYDLAAKFYTRALALDPSDARILDNFEMLELNRLPGGKYAGAGPSATVLKRSEVKEERGAWGEYQLMLDRKSPDPTFKTFWYNRLTRETFFKEPDWKEVAEGRAQRSEITYDNTNEGIVDYWDPLLKMAFQYNKRTKLYTWPKLQGEADLHA